MNAAELHPVRIEVPAHWFDHRIDGRAVVPAAEALQVLARETLQCFSDVPVSDSHKAIFSHFLPLPTGQSSIEAFVRLLKEPGGAITASLLTQKASKNVKIVRWIEHVQVTFSRLPPTPPLPSWEYSFDRSGEAFSITSEKLYQSLVPFGPAYRNVREPILLRQDGASSRIRTPESKPSPGASLEPLGCPFAMDAAFHVACAWGQRYQGKVTFPTGYQQRTVLEPTQRSRDYRCELMISPTEQSSMLLFDILILSVEGKPCEVLQRVRMEELFRGRIQPPSWIRS